MNRGTDANPSRVEEILNTLREEIYSNRLRPGDPITETRDRVRSQGTVRQALIRLEQLGLVNRLRNVQTTVVNLSRGDIEDLIEARIKLETLACQSPIVKRKLEDPAVVADLRRLCQRIGQGVFADEEFHHHLWDLAEKQYLFKALRLLSAPMFAFVELLRQKGLRPVEERVAAHERFLDGLLAHAPNVEALVSEHIRRGYDEFFRRDIPDLRWLATQERTDVAPTARSTGPMSRNREFLFWIPATALVLDANHHVRYANEEFERVSQKPLHKLLNASLPPSYWNEVSAKVRSTNKALLALTRFADEAKMTLCFPMRVKWGGEVDEDEQGGEPMIGELGLDVTSLVPLIESRDALTERQLHSIDPRRNVATRETIRPEILASYFQSLPAVATWKDLHGRMLWANPEYAAFTGKKVEYAHGQTPFENWGDATGNLIAYRDARVRDTLKPYLTTDRFTVRGEDRYRLTIRFPLFNADLKLEGTASLGLDRDLITEGLGRLREMKENETDELAISKREHPFRE